MTFEVRDWLDMKNDIQKSIEIYKEQLSYGYIQNAYITLTRYIAELKGIFSEKYKVSNMGLGYLDYTYFYFLNDDIKKQNLKFALVLNHKKMQFELWLCARNIAVQKAYWNLLKDSKWNQNIDEMPKYSVLEVVLENQINFNDKETMTKHIVNRSLLLSQEIQEYLKNVNC